MVDVCFYDQDLEEITTASAFSPGDRYWISSNAYVGEADAVNVFLVLYDQRGAMADLYTWEAEAFDSYIFFREEFQIPPNVEVGSVKVMLLSKAMIPLTPAASMS